MQHTHFSAHCTEHPTRIFGLRSQLFFTSLIALMFLFFCLSEASANQSRVIPLQHWQTNKGIDVYFVRITNLPILDIRLIFSAGSSYDAKKEGVALVTGSLLNEGAGGQSAEEIANTFDQIGALYQARVDRDKTTLSLRTLTKPNYLHQALTEFVLLFSQPSFLPNAFRRVKEQVISEIKANKQRPGKVAHLAFYNALYGQQFYAHDPLGSIETVSQLTQEDCKRFHDTYYVAHNAKVILVGDLTFKQAKEISQQISDRIPLGTTPLSPPLHSFQPVSKHPDFLSIPFPSQETSIVIGQLGVAPNDPDYFPLLVGNYAFGGMPLGSELFLKIRDQKGLSYYVESYFTVLKYRGPFEIFIKTEAGKTKEALSLSTEALKNFVEKGISKQQLDYAKKNLENSFPLLLASNDKIAEAVSSIAFYKRPLTYLDTYIKNIRKVNTDQVKRAFQRLIDLNNLFIITVGPNREDDDKKKKRGT